MLAKISNYMDGSLIFRALTWVLVFIRQLFGASFIAGFFVADNHHHQVAIGSSFFAKIINVVNIVPKPIKPPTVFPAGLARFIQGSFIINTPITMLDTPVPNESGTRSRDGVNGFFAWVFNSAPVWGFVLIVFATPLLPTMWLAALLVPVLILLVLSRRFEINHFTVFLLLYIIVNLMAGVLSLEPASSIPIAVLSSVFMASAFAVSAVCRTRSSIDFFFFIFVIGAASTGLIGLYQYFVGDTLGIWLDQDAFAGLGRVVSTFGNPNVYGTYLLLAIPLAAACIVYAKNMFYKLCAIGITGLLVINLLLTLSRGCYLALAFAAGIFVLMIEKRLIVAFIPAVVSLLFVLPPTIVNRLFSILNFQDTSTAFRLSIWQGSLRILQDFWMTGLGQGIDAYNRVYPYYAFAAIVSPHSHNLFIQIFVELGLAGLIAFIAVLACFFREMVNFLRRTTDFRLRVVAAAFISAVIGFLFQGIFDHVFYNYRVMLVFFIFLGLGLAFVKVAKITND